MNKSMLSLAIAGAVATPAFALNQAAPAPATPRTFPGQMVLYEQTNYNGASWTLDSSSGTVRTNWPIRSLTIHPGERWQICARPRFRECIVIDRSVPDARVIGIENQIGSARPAPADAQ